MAARMSTLEIIQVKRLGAQYPKVVMIVGRNAEVEARAQFRPK